MRASEVNNRKWANFDILFDNGDFSAIWGCYDGDSHKGLGLRWNANEGGIGFPQTSAHPVWFLVPSVLTQGVLENLLCYMLRSGCHCGEEDKIRAALRDHLCTLRARTLRLAVALYAPSEKGKTSTLNILIDLLCKEGELLEENRQGIDRCAVVNYRGLIVGVGTGGDWGSTVQENFAVFEKHRCDVVFCATRKRSDSYSWKTFWQHTADRGIRYVAVPKVIASSGASKETIEAINTKQAMNLLAKYL